MKLINLNQDGPALWEYLGVFVIIALAVFLVVYLFGGSLINFSLNQ